MRRTFSLLLALMLLAGMAATLPVSPAAADGLGPITVATMIDSEGAVLGGMMVLLLRQAGFEVVDRTEFGTPDILRAALMAGEVDLVLDYTGSGQYYHQTDATDAWSDALEGYALTRDLDREANDLIWLTPADANNTEGLAVRRAFAEENGLKTIGDLAAYINAGKPVKLIAAASFAENVKGLIGFEEAYGFQLRADQLITQASGNTAEMRKALYEKRDGVNVSLVYGTDGTLKEMDLVVLEDPQSIPPVYLPTPVLRGELHRVYPQIEEILKPLFLSLTLETLQGLNAQVVFGQKAAREVATDYLKEIGLLASK